MSFLFFFVLYINFLVEWTIRQDPPMEIVDRIKMLPKSKFFWLNGLCSLIKLQDRSFSKGNSRTRLVWKPDITIIKSKLKAEDVIIGIWNS
jgi:hypothetical protein